MFGNVRFEEGIFGSNFRFQKGFSHIFILAFFSCFFGLHWMYFKNYGGLFGKKRKKKRRKNTVVMERKFEKKA